MKKYTQFINEEVGLRNISKIAKLHKTAEIYFHKDLDGVTSALAMKTFLKNQAGVLYPELQQRLKLTTSLHSPPSFLN